MQRKCRQGVDGVKAAQPHDRRPPSLIQRELGESLCQRGLAGADRVDARERVSVGQLGAG
jgi:hypothetical protein